MIQPDASSRRLLRLLCALAGVYLFLRWLLLPLLPFLLALSVSALLEPLILRLQRRFRLRRRAAAAIVLAAVLLIAGTGLSLLLLHLLGEADDLAGRLPDMLSRFPGLWNRMLDRVSHWYVRAPQFMQRALDILADCLAQQLPALMGAAGEQAVGWFSALAGKLPDMVLFLVTSVLALFFSVPNYPAILSFCKRQLPPSMQRSCRKLARCYRTTLLKWLRAEGLLLLTTFLLLLLAFFWMKLPYALLAAAAIAIIDALPVLGTGTVLLPWALLCLPFGQQQRAILLVLLYAVVTVVHSFLEPRLLAGQAELPPIAALLAMYLGFRFFGITGMIFLPVLLLFLKQLHDAGILSLWK